MTRQRRFAVAASWTLGIAAGCLVVTPVAALADQRGFLHPLGPLAKTQALEFYWATAIVMVAILPVLIGTPWIMWRYRRSNEAATYRPQWHFDTKLEILMWGLPIVIVVMLGIWLAQAVYKIDPYRPIDEAMAEDLRIELQGPPLQVQVVGLDWKWLFIYPEVGAASVGEMVMPVGHPMALRLTTDTVMQAFLVPRIGGQIYAMPRMVTKLHLIADRPGETVAVNTQYTGTGMAGQRAAVRAVERTEFDDWLAGAEDAPRLDAESYAVLAQSGSVADAREALGLGGEGPIMFRLEEPRLFERIVARYGAEGGVPRAAQPGSPDYDARQGILPEVSP